jgi:hypothetical protein
MVAGFAGPHPLVMMAMTPGGSWLLLPGIPTTFAAWRHLLPEGLLPTGCPTPDATRTRGRARPGVLVESIQRLIFHFVFSNGLHEVDVFFGLYPRCFPGLRSSWDR